MPHLLPLSIAMLVGIYVFSLSFGMYYGFGERHYWFYEVLHFVGEFFSAMFLSNFFASKTGVLAGLALISFIWELHEYFIAKISKFSQYYKRKFRLKKVEYKWSDTILDIILNFAGTFTFILLDK